MKVKIYRNSEFKELESDFSFILDQLDIYYQPAFLNCDALVQDGTPEVFTCYNQATQEVFIYPYLRRAIPDSDLEDIRSPYGYAGPYASNESFATRSELSFLKHAKDEGFVTEFVRYHFQYNQTLLFQNNCQNILNRNVVILDLTKSPEVIWEDEFSKTNRNLVRKLEKLEFNWKTKDFEKQDISWFKKLYDETMQNANAEDFYLFPSSYYETLIDQLGSSIRICWVEKEDERYAASLFYVSGGIITYFLSGRNLNYPKISATNLLLSKLAMWGSENKYESLNFGGGLSLSAEDRLFKFKQNFSKSAMPFYIGKRIHNESAYAQLKTQYIEKFGVEKFDEVKHFLQFYLP